MEYMVKSLFRMLVSDGYSFKFILNDVLLREIDFASKKVVIFIDNESAIHKNKVIESEIKKNHETRVLRKNKKDIIDVLQNFDDYEFTC